MNQLDWYFRGEHELYSLIFNKIVEDADRRKIRRGRNSNNNILSANVLKLFENAQKMIIYSTDKRGITSYSFSLSSFLSVIGSYRSWDVIVVKAVCDVDDVHGYEHQRSWLYEECKAFIDSYREFGGNGLELEETKTNDGRNEDTLSIHREKVDWNKIPVYPFIFMLDSKTNSTSSMVADDRRLTHFIDHKLRRSSDIEMPNISKHQYEIFNDFCDHKAVITSDIDDLSNYLKLFANVRMVHMQLDGRESLNKLLSIISLSSYSHSITITAANPEDSWISKLWLKSANDVQKQFAAKQWKISYYLAREDSGRYPIWVSRLNIEKNIWMHNLNVQSSDNHFEKKTLPLTEITNHWSASNISTLKGSECRTAESSSDIINGCTPLQRLSVALKWYHAYCSSEIQMSEQALVMFGDQYSQILDDYKHLLLKHASTPSVIAMELVSKLGFQRCDDNFCLIINRRDVAMSTDPKYSFYCDLFDSLHNHIFHTMHKSSVTEQVQTGLYS